MEDLIGMAILAIGLLYILGRRNGAPEPVTPPDDKGVAAEGHVTVGIIAEGDHNPYVSVILKVTGLATHGVPAPNMRLQLYIDNSPSSMKDYPSVTLGQEYYLEDFYSVPGYHEAYAKLTLTNIHGTFPLTSGTIGFEIGEPGEEPAGHVTVGY